MEYLPAPLEKLVEQFAKLPGVGGKSAQRLAFHVLNLPQEEAEEFSRAILDAKRQVTLCPRCRNLTSGGLCPICASPKRDETTVCVVADPRDVVAMERAREFNGHYHVLHGVLSPMNRVGPDDIRIRELMDEGLLKPELVIGVPVGFVNVVESKELIIESSVPHIVARGRKGGSNVAAAICNALLYQIFAGIGDGGSARIRHQSAALTPQQAAEELFAHFCPIVLKIADERFFNFKIKQS